MIGKVLNQRYKLEEELGRGGMGLVYRGYDQRLDRPVAIKVLNTNDLGSAGQVRLLAEARAVASLNHPNIVDVYDADEADGSPFIVMELVSGQTLRQHHPREVSEILEIAIQMVAALDHAHSQGIIHRDLKLENIVLTQSNTIKLMDFGLARSRSAPRLTEEGSIVGTFACMAPELITGSEPSPQSDLYALGVMLYEMLTGRPPFEGRSAAMLLTAHLHAPVMPPRMLNSAIPPALDTLVTSLLSKKPADRPASAADVLRILETQATGSAMRIARREALPVHNLPAQLSSFVGRQGEIALVQRRLEVHRLVTLTGSGGVGKTRLALQVAQLALPDFPQGIWLVELASLTDPQMVPQALAGVLGVRGQPGQPLLDTLSEYLVEKNILIILDNCEHVIDMCAQLAELLLSRCPQLRLLATSREALGIEGESSVRIPSLSLPPAGAGNRDVLDRSDAVKLFVERAAAVLPDFRLTRNNVDAVINVCRRLDGIALAIELAAARVKVLKVDQIAARLDDAFRLLTGGSRTALPRQQTLRATIDWSHNLLSEPERILLRRLAVFLGGWTLEAAEAVCGELKSVNSEQVTVYSTTDTVHCILDTDEILDLLTHLVDKSLVVVEREQGQEARYRLLETIRQYAREKLYDSAEGESVRERHCRWFSQLAEQAAPELIGPAQIEWLDRLGLEHDNLRAALEWSSERGDHETVLRIAGALQEFWKIRSFFQEGIHWCEASLAALPGEPAPSDWYARALVGRGTLAWYVGDLDTLQRYIKKAQAVYQALEDRRGIAHTMAILASVPNSTGDADGAEELYQRSLEIRQEIGDRGGIAACLHGLSNAAKMRGDLKKARALLEQSAAIRRESGDLWRLMNALGDLAWYTWDEGDVTAACGMFAELLTGYQQLRSRWGLAYSYENLVIAATFQGEYGKAHDLCQEALSHSLSAGDKLSVARIFLNLGKLAFFQGDLDQALLQYQESLQIYREVGYELGRGWALGYLGALACVEGSYTQAEVQLQEALALQEGKGEYSDLCFTLCALGTLSCRQNQPLAALGFYRRALEIGKLRLPDVLQPLEGVATVAAMQGQVERAARLFGAAHGLRRRFSSPRPPVERACFEEGLSATREALSKEAFTAAWETGAQMTVEQIIAFTEENPG